MKYFSLIKVLVLLVSSCGTGPEKGNPINPNIVQINIEWKDGFPDGSYHFGSWIDTSEFIITNPVLKIQTDDKFVINSVDTLQDFFANGYPYYSISLSSDKSSALLIESEFLGTSLGSLVEYKFSNNSSVKIKRSTINVSSAVYWHGDDNKLVYYSYGNDQGLEAGYYLYDKAAGTDSLLLAHRSPAGPSEVLNGFDLSPDNTKLLYPDVRATPSTSVLPQIIEYDLTTRKADTLDIQFEPSNRIGLWMRYSPDGSDILYVNFPFGALQDVSGGTSEVGLIDASTKIKRILDVNTNDRNEAGSVQLTANWSPDGQHIIYGSGRFFLPEGVVGTYSLYILKNVYNPENYIK